ncbi:aminotransferase class III-fold pyridoxal phosphate-dependent enzyme [Accumulibacter sp.]|uniref:aminotransferase class III-fold pyridoxal phosphate-dependent enzyme n=1 Tax=Accumulibacter sp. TaxID=2053492 RepID=UPI00262760CA|nr:aminotransferase class III-fold pyridoxal phosphate-dependent enzyme [Accumulibacter sp.]
MSNSPDLDLSFNWLPFTPNRDFRREPKILARAKGMFYYDPAGRPIIDGSSGLFAVAAGHGREEITQAVSRQLDELDFAPSFYRGNPPAFLVAEKLAGILPAGLDRVFLVNSGSEAVDTAIKIALLYHRARGEAQRTLFVSRERAYHGVNLGGLGLSGIVNNRRHFASQLPNVPLLRHTCLAENRFTRGLPKHGAELADDLLRIIATHGAENIAAVFVEPIAGSTGVLLPPQGYLERLRAITSAHGILLVFDEVICGFGRTGKAFAAQSFAVRPDLLTVAKAITNGAIPMGAVAVDRGIHEAIIDAAPDLQIEFFHGYTSGGHPVAAAAAIATLEIYQRQELFARGEALSSYFIDQLFTLRELPVVTDIRAHGLIAGIDLAPDGAPGIRGYRMQKTLFDRGLHIKTTGDAVIVAPALVAERHHIDEIVAILRRALAEER